MISFTTPNYHWNYFLALESDLENVARYIEFSDHNFTTYSIELTHILLAAASEVDVLLKQLCQLVAPTKKAANILDYKKIITQHLSIIIKEEVTISRYGLSTKPFENWASSTQPFWWTSYNKVKHQRNDHFREANLKNAINAVGALLISAIHYYQLSFTKEYGQNVDFRETTRQLSPQSKLIRINADYYTKTLIT